MKEFKLVKVDFFYHERIDITKIRGYYKSSNSDYEKLLVIDKENDGSKADTPPTQELTL